MKLFILVNYFLALFINTKYKYLKVNNLDRILKNKNLLKNNRVFQPSMFLKRNNYLKHYFLPITRKHIFWKKPVLKNIYNQQSYSPDYSNYFDKNLLTKIFLKRKLANGLNINWTNEELLHNIFLI